MRLSTSAIASLVAPLVVSAAPLRRQQPSAADATNLLVLNFANVLNQLESEFYTQALQTFQSSDFTSAGFSNALLVQQQFQNIQADEAVHIETFEGAIEDLGSQPLSGCQFDFSSVLTDVATVAATARVVENVGVAAFLGAAHLLSDSQLLTTAAAILTTEARHQSILNILSGTGEAIPQAFDIVLSPPQILAIAGPFISGCNLGVPANPTLTITNSGSIGPGTSLTFSSDAIPTSLDPSTLSCQMVVGGASNATVFPFQSCIVPSNLTGPVAIFVTNSSTPLSTNVITQDTSSIVAGPTLTFIDVQPQVLGQLTRSVSGSSNPSSSDNGSSNSSSSSDSSSPPAIVVDGTSNSTSIDSDSSNNGTSIDSGSSVNSTSSGGIANDASTPLACGDPSQTNGAASLGGPNLYEGPTANCDFSINGWQNVPQSSL